MKLRNGWLKDQMEKATKEVRGWPDWMKKLDEAEEKMQKQKSDTSQTSK